MPNNMAHRPEHQSFFNAINNLVIRAAAPFHVIPRK
jgi:hypothetical protein